MNSRLLFTFFVVLFSIQVVYGGVSQRTVDGSNYRVATILKNVRPNWVRSRLIKSTGRLIKNLRNSKCASTVCFAIEGTSNQPYSTNKLFVRLISAIASADSVASYSAVQYVSSTKSISRRTARYYTFLNGINKSQKQGGSKSNLGAGLGYCGGQVRKLRQKGVVVTIGSGKYNIGISPLIVANVIKKTDNIIAVSSTTNSWQSQKNLGLRGRNVVVLRYITDIENALNKIIPMICKK